MKKFLSLFLALSVVFGCAKENDFDNQGEKRPELAPAVTVGVDQISAVSVVLMGKANLGSTVSADMRIGFQYSKYAGILPGNSTTVEAINADKDYNFSSLITNLEPATTYYFRSFVRQNGQDTYGETKEFKTKDLSSLIFTQEATSVSAVSARLNASFDLTNINCSSKFFGFSWGTSQASLTNTLNATGDEDTIYADLSGLSPSVTYYFQSYVTLDGKKIKNNVVSFTTKDLSSLLYTHEASNIESTSVTLNAKLDLTDVKYSNIKYGFYWGTSETSQTTFLNGGEVNDNIYSASLSGLRPVVQYWYKSYVKLDNQVLYGEVKTFATDVIHVQSVSLDIEEYTFNYIGDALTLSATVLPGDATDKSITWTSDNEDVASVDSNGKVTARGNGTATISVTTTDQGKTASCAITVAQLVTGVTLDNMSISLNEGESQTLTATITPDNAKDKTLTWTSSNGDVATVDGNGKVTAVSKGTATITATTNDGSEKFANCSVTVKRLVSSITLDKTSFPIYVGKTETLTATVSPSTANNTLVTWTSSNMSIAAVSGSGVITGKTRGNVTITATANDGSGVKATCEVEVRQYVTSIKLDKTSLSLIIGDETILSVAKILPDNANDKTYSWSSSDEGITTIDNVGRVTAKAKGSATLSVSANDGSGISASCSVIVRNPCPTGAVDLGLSVHWASCNLSESGFVNTPEEYGDYYAWGETDPKDNYSWSTYKFSTSSYGPFSKYNTIESDGPVDNKTVLEPGDDVARVKLGGKWRMPTDEEWIALKNNCTLTWTDNYNGTGVKGEVITSNMEGYKNNSIFLPAAGNRYGTNLYNAGSYGYYWSSSLNTDSPYYAWLVYFYSYNVNRNYYNRYLGQSVRPVSE